MKRVFYFLVITAIALPSCKKDNEIATCSVNVINGKMLYGGEELNDRVAVVKFLVNAERKSDPVSLKYVWLGVEVAKGDYRNGDFKINLPDNVDDLKPFDLELPPKAKVSNKYVMYANSGFIAYNKDDEQVGYFYYTHFFFCEETYVESGVFYFDRDFTITGSDREEDHNWSINCNFKKGWNFMFLTHSRNSDGINTVDITTSEPNCMYWNFETNSARY